MSEADEHYARERKKKRKLMKVEDFKFRSLDAETYLEIKSK